MKKGLKKAGIILIRLLAVLIAIILIYTLYQRIATMYERHIMPGFYGEKVSIDGGDICYDVQGSGDNVVVLLPGWGTPSPILDMYPYALELAKNNTVVTIEYFGYGLSDDTDKERTIENITVETHEVLQKLGYTSYTLMPHSISGLYSIYYANQYPNEVKAVVGIDTSIPDDTDIDASVEGTIAYAKQLRILNAFGLVRLITAFDPSQAVSPVTDYDRSKEELHRQLCFYRDRLMSDNVVNEMKNTPHNTETVMGMKYPDSIPVTFFLASVNVDHNPYWVQAHQNQFGNNDKNQIKVLEGPHYLYHENAVTMAKTYDEWIGQ